MQDTVINFLKTTDESFVKLSHMQEQKLSDIPSWILSNRKIQIAFASFTNSYLIIITPDKLLGDDVCTNLTIDNQEQLNEFTTASPPGFTWELNGGFIMLADMDLREANKEGGKDLYGIPVFRFNGLITRNRHPGS
jgi:hypothetical protein